jgi:serine/threonine protein kinase
VLYINDLKKLVHYNPAKRITAADALKHPFLAEVNNANNSGSSSSSSTSSNANTSAEKKV